MAGHRSLALMLVLLAPLGCDRGWPGYADLSEQGVAVSRTDSAGIEVVVSGEEARTLAWSLDERFALGGEADGPESFYQLYPGAVGADRHARIHVLDRQSHQVVTFDSTGAFVREVGRQGGGPGELERPSTLGVTSAGALSVFDFGKMALVRWDSAGEPLPRLPFPHPPMAEGRHHALTDDGYLVSTWGVVNDRRVNRLMAVAGEDTTVLAGVPQPGRGMVRFERCGGGINFPPLFTPSVAWDHRDSITAVAAGTHYRIDVWRDGRIVRSIRRPVPVTRATRELAMAEAGDGVSIDFGRGPCPISAEEYADARGWAETVPAIRRIALTPGGALWVQRWVPGADPMPIDLFNAVGAYVGTLPRGTEFPALLMPDGRVGVIRSDTLDVARLVVGVAEREPRER